MSFVSVLSFAHPLNIPLFFIIFNSINKIITPSRTKITAETSATGKSGGPLVGGMTGCMDGGPWLKTMSVISEDSFTNIYTKKATHQLHSVLLKQLNWPIHKMLR